MLRENTARPAPPPAGHIRPLAILVYHSIGRGASPITMTRERFRGQIAALQRAGIRGVSLGEALTSRRRAGGRRVVALTFDDGFADFATEAWPVLREAGFSATVFLVTGRLGKDNDWPGQPGWAPRLPLLSRGEVRRLAREGVEFGSHSVSHPWLPTVAPDVAATELALSRQAIEAATGAPCRLFAYPYGALNAALRFQVAEYYSAAVTTELRIAVPADDRYRLPRIDATYLAPALLAGAIYSPAVGAYLALRRAGRGVRRTLLRDR
ncbi:MAG: polysaccharide deacetylase [Dehalococcoidia bacterium]|jgi:peptidoglycan/xylan/chitin deacetylase (PgdA/CDA1 family)|nr:MAG: polysaccharide deacetylase [Dehalococcoidia bacterium]